MLRLQKYIADCGITSRRKAEELIAQGRVSVNGEVVRQLGTKVNPEEDAVMVNGQAIDHRSVAKVYLVMNKPRCIMTTLEDPEGRKTVIDLIKEVPERVYPVGRLDYLSEGLLLLTNDGDLANQIIHPSANITKVYEVKVFGAVTEALLKKLRGGATVDGIELTPSAVRVIKQLPTKTWIEFRLTEGKNREIRKICEAYGITIDKLKRVAIGGLSVDGISPGSYRYITKAQLQRAIGFNKNGTVNEDLEYWSGKKSVSLKLKGAQNCTSADDKAFHKFRKGDYFKTVAELKERKEKEAKEIRTKAYEEKEAAHQARQKKKKDRQRKKSEEKNGGVHAQFVK
ncbi:pseudouridine synthase [Bacteriovoracaceae bacterium]|nr:pseudouridine synthase [Bacteriovoracaceae bacterium]|tara:strand:- start:59361 stop:60383 length:1023 start_codon:yes stop_codon:yes gene_type:complete